MDINYYQDITDWIKQQWHMLTFEYILYLAAFSFILSYVTEYLLKIKEIRWIYYSLIIILIIKLIEGDHPVSAAETIYKLVLI
jgi:hypothetical protein